MEGQALRDYLDFVVDPSVRRFCGPVFFINSLQTPANNIFGNGSFSLIDTGQRRLLVTCHHVWEDFKKLRNEHPNLMFGVCLDFNNPIVIYDIDDALVDEDKRCDLATFDIASLSKICTAGGLEFFNLHVNRPPKLEEGVTIYLIGFPAKGRQDDTNSIGFPRQAIGVAATHVGDLSFFSDVTTLQKDKTDFAGISGSPCFLVTENRPVRLVGFTTGYAPNNMNMLQFTHARCIQPNGIIQYMC